MKIRTTEIEIGTPENQPDVSSFIRVNGVSKAYRRRLSSTPSQGQLVVFENFTLEIAKGELVSVFGPNGCGKTTLLNIVAGIVPSDSGLVLINSRPPTETRLGFVFQNFRESLFPWRTVLDNICLPLEVQGVKSKERRQAGREFLRDHSISVPENAYPYELSGGQQQLVAIVRALIGSPDVLLMDEPFNQLDYKARIQVRTKFLELWETKRPTTIFVTHDATDALLLGQRIAVLSARPSSLIKDMKISLPWPRNNELLSSPVYKQLLVELLTYLD